MINAFCSGYIIIKVLYILHVVCVVVTFTLVHAHIMV